MHFSVKIHPVVSSARGLTGIVLLRRREELCDAEEQRGGAGSATLC